MFEALLSVGTVDSITLIESVSIEATGPLVTSPSAGVGLGAGIGLALALVAGAVYLHDKYGD